MCACVPVSLPEVPPVILVRACLSASVCLLVCPPPSAEHVLVRKGDSCPRLPHASRNQTRDSARRSGVNLSCFADVFGGMPLPLRFHHIPNLWLATSDPPAIFFLHAFCVHLPQLAPLESSPPPLPLPSPTPKQAHWWERWDRV